MATKYYNIVKDNNYRSEGGSKFTTTSFTLGDALTHFKLAPNYRSSLSPNLYKSPFPVPNPPCPSYSYLPPINLIAASRTETLSASGLVIHSYV